MFIFILVPIDGPSNRSSVTTRHGSVKGKTPNSPKPPSRHENNQQHHRAESPPKKKGNFHITHKWESEGQVFPAKISKPPLEQEEVGESPKRRANISTIWLVYNFLFKISKSCLSKKFKLLIRQVNANKNSPFIIFKYFIFLLIRNLQT